MSAPDLAKAQQHFEHAMLQREKGKLELAVSHFREARRHYPAAPVAGHLGILLAELGRSDEAITEFSAAVAADPADAGAYFRLGMLLAGQKRDAEAAAAYEGFIRHCPPDMSGQLDFIRSRVAELRKTHEAGPKQTAPDAKALDRAKGQQHFEHALLQRSKGKLELALSHFREALRLYPVAPVHGHLGVLLGELGRFDEAIEEFSAAVAADPADAGAYFRLGMLLAGQKRDAEAAAAYEGFIRHCPPEMSGHLEFARARVAALREVPEEASTARLAVPEAHGEPPAMLAPLPSPVSPDGFARRSLTALRGLFSRAAEKRAPAAERPAAGTPAAPSSPPPSQAALRWTLAAGAATVALAWGTRDYGAAARERYERWRWPAATSTGDTLAAPMLRDNALRRMADVVTIYNRTEAALAAAEGRGQDVTALRQRLTEAEELMHRGETGMAVAVLNIVELRIPRPAEKVAAAEREEGGVASIVKEQRKLRPRGSPAAKRR